MNRKITFFLKNMHNNINNYKNVLKKLKNCCTIKLVPQLLQSNKRNNCIIENGKKTDEGGIGMLYSSDRKLALSGWLKENNIQEYNASLKFQKFLFFYESFSKTFGDKCEFDRLGGWERGPVFSKVWGDYTKERESFDRRAELMYKKYINNIDILRAKKCAFLVQTLSEIELSELTHKMNIWNAKSESILNGDQGVILSEEDFNEDDINIIKLLDKMYSKELIENSVVIQINNYSFVFSKTDAKKLTEKHQDILAKLSEKTYLNNPVYVEIDEEGRLMVD